MNERSVERLPSPSKSWTRRLLGFFLPKEGCPCGEGVACADLDKICPWTCDDSCSEMCAIREWTENNNGVEKPDRPTLSTVPAGEKADIEQLYLPLALKKRLFSLGLTYGTEVAVVSNEKGRMIIAVRDSRLALSPEVASKITYKSA